jgi:hypothetical protein
MEDREAERLMLEALFDIRREVHDIHREIFGPGGDNDVEGPEEADA